MGARMPRARVSLLDDPEFLDELARIDLPESAPDFDLEPPSFLMEPVGPSRPRRAPQARRATGRVVFGLLGFFVMMALGSAAAAFVFADRVAVILAR